MSAFRSSTTGSHLGLFYVLACLLGRQAGSTAQPVTVSTSITNMATNVALTTKMVFTFSEPMILEATTPIFLDLSNYSTLVPISGASPYPYIVQTVSPPERGWPAGSAILWFIEYGLSRSGEPLLGEKSGMFFTRPNPPPVILHPGISGGAFEFEVSCSPGQSLVIESNTDLLTDGWQTVCTTNTSSDLTRITDARPLTGHALFYRVRIGP
ncbi:MAG TPA: Ig-like domain-containing protein [Verrucomicrobiae bacterium]